MLKEFIKKLEADESLSDDIDFLNELLDAIMREVMKLRSEQNK